MTEEPRPKLAAGPDAGTGLDSGTGTGTGLDLGDEVDVVIVEVTERDGGWGLDVVITTGPRKGDVLELGVSVPVGPVEPNGDRPVDPLELLGLAATVVVTDDGPRLRL